MWSTGDSVEAHNFTLFQWLCDLVAAIINYHHVHVFLVFLGLAASVLNVCHVNVISGTKEMDFTLSGSVSLIQGVCGAGFVNLLW